MSIFVAIFEDGLNRNAIGWGKTLEEAFEMLKKQTDENVIFDHVWWYESTPISVSVKITKKAVLTKE